MEKILEGLCITHVWSHAANLWLDGWHLVFILERTDADYPPLEEIRSDLVADFDYQRRTQAKTEAYEKLKERYEIIIVEPGETSKQ